MFEKKWTDRVSAHLTHIEAARVADKKLFNDVLSHLRQSTSSKNQDSVSKANGVATIFYRNEPACSFRVEAGGFVITSPDGQAVKQPTAEGALDLMSRLQAECVDRHLRLVDAA